MNYIARYIYKRPYNGTYAKNYIYITENNEMLIVTLVLCDESELAPGEALLRKFKDKQLVIRSSFFSLGTAYVIGSIASKHKNDSSIKGHFTVKLKDSSNL